MSRKEPFSAPVGLALEFLNGVSCCVAETGINTAGFYYPKGAMNFM